MYIIFIIILINIAINNNYYIILDINDFMENCSHSSAPKWCTDNNQHRSNQLNLARGFAFSAPVFHDLNTIVIGTKQNYLRFPERKEKRNRLLYMAHLKTLW